jgi:hypothetical protein
MRLFSFAQLQIGILLLAGMIGAAPLPPMKPVTVTGTIVEAKWVAEREVKGSPGMSGSLGHDRKFPAHFIIGLKDLDGVTTEAAARMTGLLGSQSALSQGMKSAPMVLLLNDDNKDHLKAEKRIRVTNYQVSGDEGGTWTKYDKVEILSN